MKPWNIVPNRRKQEARPQPTAAARVPGRPPSQLQRALAALSDLDCWALVVLGGVMFVGTSQALFHSVWWTPSTPEIVLIALGVWAVTLSGTVGAGLGLVVLRGMTLPDEDTVAERARRAVEAAAERTAARAATLQDIAQEWGELVQELDDADAETGLEVNTEPNR